MAIKTLTIFSFVDQFVTTFVDIVKHNTKGQATNKNQQTTNRPNSLTPTYNPLTNLRARRRVVCDAIAAAAARCLARRSSSADAHRSSFAVPMDRLI
jgi:hypothetical protein